MQEEEGGVAAPLLQESRSSMEGQNSKLGASFCGAVFNISTTMIGAGIMSIPATIKVLGIVPGFLVILIVAFLVDITMEFLLRYTNTGNSTTYAGIVAQSFGPFGSIAVQICVVITNLGCLIIYFIIIGKLHQLLDFLFVYMFFGFLFDELRNIRLEFDQCLGASSVFSFYSSFCDCR